MIYNFLARQGTDLEYYYSKHKDGYNKQALDFLKETKTLLKIDFSHKGKHFYGDKQNRNIYRITLTNKKHTYTFNFGDSIINTEKKVRKNPTPYDILACLNVDYSEDFNDFCDNFGYDAFDEDNPKGNFINKSAYKVYLAVEEETNNLKQLFNEQEQELLHEIQ